MMKRICVLSTLYPPIIKGGAEISTHLVVNELSARYKVKVISVNLLDEKVVEHGQDVEITRVACRNNGLYEHRPTDVRGKIVSRLRNFLDSRRHREVAAEIKHFKPDLVWLNNLNLLAPRIGTYLRDANVKIVQTVRDYRPFCDRMMVKDGLHCPSQCLRCKLAKFRIKQNYNLYDSTVGISDYVGNILLSSGYTQQNRYQTIYNPVADLSKGMGTTKKKAKFTVGFIGSLTTNKGIELLLKLAAYLPDIDFKLASQLNTEAAKRVLKGATQNVEFLGFMKPRDFFNRIHCLLVPSKWEEPFGRVAAEGLSAKIPVFVSDRGGLPEIVENEVSGEVHPSEDLSSWIDGINRLQAEPERVAFYIENGYQRYKDKFALEQVSAQYENLFERILTTAN
jgi:glycosyltransferase involved in cell wall biosynthesis